MTRLNLFKGLGPALQLVEGYTVELDEEVHDVLDPKYHCLGRPHGLHLVLPV